MAILCERIPENVETDKATIIQVSSTEAAVGPVATAFQGYPAERLKLVGVTGTNGKTTTKELVHAVLSRRYRTHATMGNFNNHLGVPLTLLSIPTPWN